MKNIEIKKGERKRIIFQFSNSLAQTHEFLAKPLNKKDKLEGEIEIKGSNWIFPKQVVRQKLLPKNSVEKKAWDSFYSVYVTPKQDIQISLTSSPIKNLWLFIIIILVIIGLASSLFFTSL